MTHTIAANSTARAISPRRGAGDTATTTEPRSGVLVTTETSSHNLDWERHALDMQRAMWRVTRIKSLAGCHRWRAANAAHVGVVWRGQKSGRFMGLQNSHSVWGSPLAALEVMSTRRNEVAGALENWLDVDGHSAVFLTATLRHDKGQELTELWDALGTCWRAATSGSGAWNGTKSYEGDKRRYGVKHWIKSVEVTHGGNGWHPHVHAVLLLERRLSNAEVDTLKARFYSRWAGKAHALGLQAPTALRGVKIDQLGRAADSSDLAGYLTKGMVSGLSAEATGGAVKAARGNNRTPFQILEDMAADIAAGRRLKPRDVAIWQTWEAQSQGRRFMAWSKGAKAALGVLELDDKQAAELAERAEDGENAAAIAAVDGVDWGRISSDSMARLSVQRAANAETFGQAQIQVAAALEALGVSYRLIHAPVTYEGLGHIAALDSALGRPEVVRGEARGVLEGELCPA